MHHKTIIAVLLGLAVAACDPISGVKTEANLARPVDIDCIDRTVRNTLGVGTVEHRTDRDESFQITPYRGKVMTISEAWTYGGDRGGTVQVSDDGKSITYFNGRLKMGKPLPEADLDAFVPLMNRINDALEQSCGLPLRSVGTVSRN